MEYGLVLALIALVVLAAVTMVSRNTNAALCQSSRGLGGTICGNFTEYSAKITSGAKPNGITAGPDGALWFTESGTGMIGRITTAGDVHEYDVGVTPGCNMANITSGPDGNLWFTEAACKSLGRFNPVTGKADFYTTLYGGARVITKGPDGKLWFTEGGAIGRATTAGAGALDGEFPAPASAGIAAGLDGMLWFAETGVTMVGRMTTAATPPAATPFDVSPLSPYEVTSGPDGAIWFSASPNNIGRRTASDAVLSYPSPTPASGPAGIVAGPDGAVWFTELFGNKIGRLTTAGVFTEYPIPTASSSPQKLAVGSDGGIWFTETDGNKIGVLR